MGRIAAIVRRARTPAPSPAEAAQVEAPTDVDTDLADTTATEQDASTPASEWLPTPKPKIPDTDSPTTEISALELPTPRDNGAVANTDAPTTEISALATEDGSAKSAGEDEATVALEAVDTDEQPEESTPVTSAPADVETVAPSIRGFRQRSKLRRRLRYLRQTRELAFRDLGGFVFDSHRFSRERTDIVAAKLEGLSSIDRELRAIEDALDEREDVTVLHEPGVAACPRCGVLHGSDANFCPGCGLPRGSHADLPLGPLLTPAHESDDKPDSSPA